MPVGALWPKRTHPCCMWRYVAPMWKRARQTGAGTAARAPRRRRSGAALALAAHGGNAAVARRLGLRVLQRKKIVNLASGTRPETLMRPPTAEDEVINVDSGHMVVAEILRDRPTAYFEQAAGELGIKREALAARAQKSASATWYGRAERETQELGMGPLAIGLMSAAVKREAYEKELRDFVVRALFERYPGRAGLERLSREVL